MSLLKMTDLGLSSPLDLLQSEYQGYLTFRTSVLLKTKPCVLIIVLVTVEKIPETHVCPQKQEALLSGIVEPQLENGLLEQKIDPFNN